MCVPLLGAEIMVSTAMNRPDAMKSQVQRGNVTTFDAKLWRALDEFAIMHVLLEDEQRVSVQLRWQITIYVTPFD